VLHESGEPGGEPLQRALAFAYRHLDRRERTIHEMRLHLERRGCDAAEVDGAVGLLVAQGYLDDVRYARLFAEDKRTLEQWGSERIGRALRGHGIDRDLIEETLSAESLDGTEGELERAVALLGRRYSTALRERRERDRALGMLLRKGYDSELALEALMAHNRLR
jgi:regulatory protein